MDYICQIQNYLHFKARPRREVVEIGAFVLYLQMGTQQADDSAAIPSTPDVTLGRETLAAIEQFFARRMQTPRFQFLDAYAPQLRPALYEDGYECSEWLPVLICLPDQVQYPDFAPLLEFTTASAQSSLVKVAEGWNINARGFDPKAAMGTSEEIEAFRQTLVTARSFTARWGGEGVAAGMFTEIEDRVTELAGITTLEPYRRCGIASALTAYMTQMAFDHGATLTFLMAASSAASRVYQRVGYTHVAHLMTWTNQEK
jgi:GNAT superfamily N-acetyltransferase